MKDNVSPKRRLNVLKQALEATKEAITNNYKAYAEKQHALTEKQNQIEKDILNLYFTKKNTILFASTNPLSSFAHPCPHETSNKRREHITVGSLSCMLCKNLLACDTEGKRVACRLGNKPKRNK